MLRLTTRCLRLGAGAMIAALFGIGMALQAGVQPAAAQPKDTLRVGEIALTYQDSTKARRLLRTDLGPTSNLWTQVHDSTDRGQTVETYFRIAAAAHQVGPGGFSSAARDSMLAFLRKAGTRHPNSEVQAEFLYRGLELAAVYEQDEMRQRLYRRLTSEHEGSYYAEEARRFFAPDRQTQVGKRLPDFELPKLSDSTATFTKGDFEGKVLLVDFWGTWCPPCIQAMPHLHQAYREHSGEGFTILSVAMKDTRKAVRNFRTEKWEMPWNHAFIPEGSALQEQTRSKFGIAGFPTAILVGSDGKVLQISYGIGSGEKMKEAIQRVAGRKDSSRKDDPEETQARTESTEGDGEEH